MFKSWRIKRINQNRIHMINEETELVYGNMRLSKSAVDFQNSKLVEDIQNAYGDYLRKERRNRVLCGEIIDNRYILITEKESGITVAEFRLKKGSEMIKNSQLVIKLLNSYENYYKAIK